jgi:hypothetical protein
MVESWFHNPSELFRSDAILSFWPTATQTPAERINASTRFIVYLACLIYLIKRDNRVLVLAAMVIAALYVLDKTGVIKSDVDCQLPTADNPMGNVLLTDYIDNPDRPPACYYPTVQDQVSEKLDDTVQYFMGKIRGPSPAVQRKAFARQFISAPVTSIPGDQTAFAEWLYGKKSAPLCRDDPSACDPNYWGPQTEAYAGLDPSNGPRGARGGHGR